MPGYSHLEEEGDGTWSGVGTNSQNNSNNQVSQGNVAPDVIARINNITSGNNSANEETSFDMVGALRNIALAVSIAQFFKK